MSQVVTKFKAWTIPGPQVFHQEVLPPQEGETLDALSGHFKIYQYKKGHRYSTDDLLVAWFGTSNAGSVSKILDLGSGIGSVGMISAWRLPGARLVTVEAQEISVELARKSVRYNQLETRYEIRLGDFRDPGVISPEERFDLILGSPPYFPMDAGLHGDHPQKIACRFEMRGSIRDYIQTAAQHLSPGGNFVCIFPVTPQQCVRVTDAAQEAGLSILRRRDVIFREGDSPLLGLFLMGLSTDLPPANQSLTWEDPPLIIRKKDGSVHPEYSVIKMSIGFPP